MGSALDTFYGQSYRANRYHMLGIHKQRAMFVLLLASIPDAFIWSKTGYILASLCFLYDSYGDSTMSYQILTSLK